MGEVSGAEDVDQEDLLSGGVIVEYDAGIAPVIPEIYNEQAPCWRRDARNPA